MANLYNVPLKNSVQHTLAGTLTQAEIATLTLDSSVATELQASATMNGMLVIDRVDVNGNLTPTKTEYISYSGVSGSTVTGLTRGLSGSSAQGHAIGAVIEFVVDVTWAQAINDVFNTQHNDNGTHKTLSLISLVSVTLNNANINTPFITGGSAVSLALNFSKLQNMEIDGASQYNSNIYGASLASATIQNFRTGGNVQRVSYISTASTTINLDLNIANVFDVTMGSNKTIYFANAISSDSLAQFAIVRLYYTGVFTPTWGNTIRWPGNVTPTPTAISGRADNYGFKGLSPTVFEGFIVGQNHID